MVADAEAAAGTCGAELSSLQVQLAAQKERLARCSAELTGVQEERAALEAALVEAGLGSKRLEHALGRAKKDAVEGAARVQRLVKARAGWAGMRETGAKGLGRGERRD